MRKQTKIAAVVSAAALLALGASITSFAASKGTWMMVDGEWYCYDKNGDVYENTFCASNGKDYYVGDDGMLVRSSWVEYDGDYYFVNSSGAKITNDWRLTTPYEDEDADEEWYYFQSTGKRAENKKIAYKGKTYFFDADGVMLTGWVTADGTQVVNEENNIDGDATYYCGEDGARLEATWIYTTEPTAEDDEADADEYYYYLKSNGHPVVNKKQNNVKGQSYIFDEEGRMLSGWVALATDSNAYMEIDDEDSDYRLKEFKTVYFCGGEDDGHVKKNKWIKTWRPADTYDEDDDNDKWWYWIEKDGKVFIPSSADAQASKYKLEDAYMVQKKVFGETSFGIAKKKVNSKDYFFNMDGEMLSQFIDVVEVYDEKAFYATSDTYDATGLYYFGGDNDGSMKTGSQSIKDDNGDTYKFYFGTRTVTKDLEVKGVGITGNKSNKLYYNGLLIKAEDYKYQIAKLPIKDEAGEVDYYEFIVNSNGSIQHSKSEYKEDGDVLIDAKEYKDIPAEDRVEFVNKTGTPAAMKYHVKNYSINNVDRVDITDVMNADIRVNAQ